MTPAQHPAAMKKPVLFPIGPAMPATVVASAGYGNSELPARSVFLLDSKGGCRTCATSKL